MAWMGKRIIKKFDAVVTLGYVLQNRVSYMVIQFGKMCTSYVVLMIPFTGSKCLQNALHLANCLSNLR